MNSKFRHYLHKSKERVIAVNYTLSPLGDSAVMIEFGQDIGQGEYEKVMEAVMLLDQISEDWLIEIVPSYTSIAVFYDPISLYRHQEVKHFPYEQACMRIEEILSDESKGERKNERLIEIPVCYGGKLGPDLSYVAHHNQLSEEEVIELHASGEYLVYMLGFAPGFPYIGGMNKKIAAPRRETPRLSIPSRSVGIAGEQTGIYPIETPGGWQLIGRTPKELFLPDEDPPTLLQAGDRIAFKPISYEEYLSLGGDAS
ncbi:5-oxoprolinase subunit PxpB [Pradoshia sp.]